MTRAAEVALVATVLALATATWSTATGRPLYAIVAVLSGIVCALVALTLTVANRNRP